MEERSDATVTLNKHRSEPFLSTEAACAGLAQVSAVQVWIMGEDTPSLIALHFFYFSSFRTFRKEAIYLSRGVRQSAQALLAIC